MTTPLVYLALAVGTFASEDLTCLAAGTLVQQGALDAVPAVLWCTLGIFVGDVGLWGVGRIWGAAARQWGWVARHLDGDSGRDAGRWLARHGASAIVGSRFLPGTRLPLYVSAGVLRMPAGVFAWWALVGALVWTPVLVLGAAGVGAQATARVLPGARQMWAAPLVTVASALLLMNLGRTLASASVRVRLAARFARWSRWEFWPMWLFYAPVALWVGLLALRHRGLSTMTASNPGMPDGGTVGESKADILARLPAQWIIPFVSVAPGAAADRRRVVVDEMRRAGWNFPIVLKPDVGQRGVGVRLARTAADVEGYLAEHHARVLAQPYHEGPWEAGVFYYRMPGAPHGRILSVTDKHFPVVVGDGRSTIEQLIWAHPRYRMQAGTFLRRHRTRLHQVLAAGESLQLTIAGNHAQGTLFRDGRHLATPALSRRIDEIARAYPGFFIGRFDIRYRDVEAFKAGRDLAIVELNGATAESTNIYDPDTLLLDAYRQLFHQWSLVFAIGAVNRKRGAPLSSLPRLAALMRAHLAAPIVFATSD
ncbi:MAG: DedA family protein [Acidobacteriota bacterium]